MSHHLCDGEALVDIPVKHRFDYIDGSLAHDPWNPKLVVHDLVDAVKRVLLVYESVEKYSKCPNVLFFATVRFALQHFGSCVICRSELLAASQDLVDGFGLTDCPDKYIKGAVLDVRCAAEINKLDFVLAI